MINEEINEILKISVQNKNNHNKRGLIGHVVGNNRQKTIAVSVITRNDNNLVRKIVFRSKKYHVHDEENQCRIGDMVEIFEVPPISKTKSWLVSRVIKKQST
jgi:small subunit ribosomal protein S17